MKPSLLQYLVCIHCKGNFLLAEHESIAVNSPEKREIIKGTLTCKDCLKQYQVTNGVPRIIDSGLSSSVDLNTGDKFGDAWKEFSRLDERYTQQFFDWIYPVGPEFIKDKIVLEAGCGKGRHSQVVAEAGAKLVFGIDIGEAIDVAFQNVGHLSNIHLIQCDIRKLPFQHSFDFAFSVGVLHHMEDPQAGFSSVAQVLKTNGSIAAWVYGKENNWWITNLVSPLREKITSNLPTNLLKALSTTLSVPVYLSSKLIARPYTNLRNKMPWLPEFFYQAYLTYISRFDFTEINHIAFDHLIAPVAYYIAKDDFVRWFNEAGYTEPLIRWHNKNSWSGFATHKASDLEYMRSLLNCTSNETENSKGADLVSL